MSRSLASLAHRLILLSVFAILAFSPPALANPVTWHLSDVTLEYGGAATGYFTYDPASQQPQHITAFDVTVTFTSPPSGVSTSYEFVGADPYVDPKSFVGDRYVNAAGWGFELDLSFWYLNLPYDLNVPGTIPLQLLWPNGVYASGTIVNTSGAPDWQVLFISATGGNLTTVPLPPSAVLLGAGLIPLAWARRKKRLGK